MTKTTIGLKGTGLALATLVSLFVVVPIVSAESPRQVWREFRQERRDDNHAYWADRREDRREFRSEMQDPSLTPAQRWEERREFWRDRWHDNHVYRADRREDWREFRHELIESR